MSSQPRHTRFAAEEQNAVAFLFPSTEFAVRIRLSKLHWVSVMPLAMCFLIRSIYLDPDFLIRNQSLFLICATMAPFMAAIGADLKANTFWGFALSTIAIMVILGSVPFLSALVEEERQCSKLQSDIRANFDVCSADLGKSDRRIPSDQVRSACLFRAGVSVSGGVTAACAGYLDGGYGTGAIVLTWLSLVFMVIFALYVLFLARRLEKYAVSTGGQRP